MQIRRASLIAAFAVAAAGTVALPERIEAQEAPRAAQVTVGNLIAALNNVNVQITRLEALNDLTIQDVRLVNVQDVLNDANIQAFNNALNRNNVEILNLRNVLNDNEVIKNALNNNQVPIAIGQVVAIDVLSGGDVIVFYQPTSQE